MARYVALLRGINVGGHKRLKMEDVREGLGALGHSDVETYLQSGNAVFTSASRNPVELGRQIQDELRSRLGIDLKVVVRSGADMARVVEANPLPDAVTEPSKLHVAFLSEAPDPDGVAALRSLQFAPDEWRLGEREVYLWYPNGAGRSKLTNDVLERCFRVSATTRNWNTVTKLEQLTAAE